MRAFLRVVTSATLIAAVLALGMFTRANAAPQAPGDSLTDETMMVNFVPRAYKLFVPHTYWTSSRRAVALVFHGYSGANTDMIPWVQPGAAKAGTIVAFPQGLGSPVTYPTGASFNAYECCGAAASGMVDDVGFAVQLITALKERFQPRRVVVAGFSNGGMLAHRVACEHAELVDGIVDASGTKAIPAATCIPSRPVHVIAIHGTADPEVPFDGGFTSASVATADPYAFRAISEVIDEWGRFDGCTVDRVTRPPGYTLTSWTSCSSGSTVELFAITNMGHSIAVSPGPVDFGTIVAAKA